MEKVTKQDILGIKCGHKKVFTLDTRRAIFSAASYAWKLGNLGINKDIERYKTQMDFRNMTIIIEALPYGRG